MERRNRQIARKRQTVRLQMPLGRRVLERPLPLPRQRETPPLQVGPRGHRGRIHGIIHVHRPLAQVDAAGDRRIQLARRQFEVDEFRFVGPVDADVRVQRTEARKLQYVLQGTARGLVHAQRAVHAFRIELQVHGIFAVAIDAARAHVGERIVERAHVHAAAQRHPRSPTGELGTEAYVLEIEAPHLDVRNGGVPPAPRGVRRALHVHVRHFEAVDGDAPLEERERRPGECNGIGGEPHPLLVGELEMTKREPRREAAPQARELDHASRQLRGDALDHRPAGIGVARDQHQSRQQRDRSRHRTQHPRRELERFAQHQNACPSPM